MIIRDLFFESGSTEATKIKQILQRYVIRKENECVYGHIFLALKTSMSISSDSENIFYII
jgi:hypothetical protein